MDEAEARARIERMVVFDREPVLSTDDVDDLVAVAKRPDAAGLSPSAVGWVPTWELNAAAAEGWERKASRAAGDFDYTDDAGSYSRSAVFDMCKRQADTFRKRILSTLPVSKNDPTIPVDAFEVAP